MAGFSEDQLEEVARPRNLVLIALVTFVVLLAALFPWDELEETTQTLVTQTTGAQLSLGEMSWAFPLGLEADDVQLKLKPDHNADLLRCDNLRLTPAWGQLFKLSLAVAMECTSGEGRLTATYTRSGDLTADLDQWTSSIPITQDGKTVANVQALSGQVRLQQYQNAWRPLYSDLTARQVQVITTLLPLDTPLLLQQLQLIGEGTPQQFRITRINSQGPLALAGQATIQWRGNSMRGNWDSQLVLTPASDLPNNLQQMLPLLGKRQPDGSYTLRHRTPFSLQ